RHRAALRLADRQPQHRGEGEAGEPGGIERHPPAVVLVDIAADEIAEEYAKISADGVDAERARAFVLVEEVGNDRLRGGCAAGFADADADASERQRGHALRHAAKNRHRAPARQRSGYDVAAVVAFWEARGREAGQRNEPHEAKA